MQQVDKILASCDLDKLDKIKKIETVLNSITEIDRTKEVGTQTSSDDISQFQEKEPIPNGITKTSKSKSTTSSTECQTLSTGDIVITKVFFPESQKKPSPRSTPDSPRK